MSRIAFNRSDTLLGVCEAIGQDLAVPSNLLRVAFALGLFWSLTVTVALYLALGAAVFAARALTPERQAAARPVVGQTAENDDEAVELARAA